ncbi:hypothetical protein [uncultured Mucilaginibacter sp.]|uniref:hypothetical protein n=1 Tax=uncultured Mucilaginibacter sp. TaxID=797541 RepID=UPI0025D05DA3|nr:hypothetical protein [uncultured Mucilaginibacter sp.]
MSANTKASQITSATCLRGTSTRPHSPALHTRAREVQWAAKSTRVLPAHNLPIAKPMLIIQAAKEFNQIVRGIKKGKPGVNNTLIFDCHQFSYQIAERYLVQLRH